MSARLLSLWLDAPGEIPAHVRPLMHVLAHHASLDAHEAWPGVDTLAHELGKSDRTVQRGLRILEDGGYIAPLYSSGGRGRASRWRVHTPLERAAAAAERQRIKGDMGVTVSQVERVTPVTRKGDTGDAISSPPGTKGVERGIERAPAAAALEGATAGAPVDNGQLVSGAFAGQDAAGQLEMPTDPTLRAIVERAHAAIRRRAAQDAGEPPVEDQGPERATSAAGDGTESDPDVRQAWG